MLALNYIIQRCILAGHDQYNSKWNEESSAKNSYNKGGVDQAADGYKDNKADYVQGGDSLHHKDHYEATKHNIYQDKHVINHNSDDNKVNFH